MDIYTPQQIPPEGDYPSRVVRYWLALGRWWASGTRLAPTMEEFRKKFEPVVSERTVLRIRHDFPGLVGSWPPKRGERPPWEHQPELVEIDHHEFNVVPDELHHLKYSESPVLVEGKPAIRVDEFDTVTKQIVRSYIDYHTVAATLVISAATMLDLMIDGHLDHFINVCRLGIQVSASFR